MARPFFRTHSGPGSFWSLGCLLVLGILVGCEPGSVETSSSTHWLKCVSDEDCANLELGATCGTESFCVAETGRTLEEVLVFEEDFEGSTLDAEKFAVEVGSALRNDELQAYTSHSENVLLEGGELVLTARAEAYDGAEYTSGSVNTEGLFSFTFGRVEARLKAPLGTGCSSSFWLTPNAPGGNVNTCVGTDPCYSGWWPAWGDISVGVVRSKSPTSVVTGLTYGIWDDALAGVVPEPETTLAPIVDATEWHTYKLEWGPLEMRWYIDDELVKTLEIPPADAYLPEGKNPFHQPFDLRLNLSVGGLDQSPVPAEYPQELRIDWVRVWRWEPRAE
jgi:beta-glucanase (GH16 family)